MKKLEFNIAMHTIGANHSIGTYKINGQHSDVYKWHDCIFYFDGVDKAVVIGNVPMNLGYHMFLNFRGNADISFKNDNSGYWNSDNVKIDDPQDDGELVSRQTHRFYTISSLRAFLSFLLFIDHYKDENFQVEDFGKLDGQLETLLTNAHIKDEIITGLNLETAERAPRIPATETLPKVQWNFENTILKYAIDSFDEIVNPLQFSKIARNNYIHYLSDVEVEIDGTKDGMTREVKLRSRASMTRTSYKCSKTNISYAAVVQTDELQYLQVRHSYTRYMPAIHTSGELIEVIPSVSPRTTELTKRSTVYNMNENTIFKDGKWQKATIEDIEWLKDVVVSVARRVQTDITNYMVDVKKFMLKQE